jgi:hypothetical protein
MIGAGNVEAVDIHAIRSTTFLWPFRDSQAAVILAPWLSLAAYLLVKIPLPFRCGRMR